MDRSRRHAVVAVAIGALALAGCATAPLTRADVDGRVVCNADQMERVEREARRDHRTVVWVNCPTATLRVRPS